jgi:hypothetical protein
MKLLPVIFLPLCLIAQDATPPVQADSSVIAPTEGGRQYKKEDKKRILGVIPNFVTTSVDAKDILKLSVKEKFQLATRDSLDPGAFATTFVLTGLSHWQRQYYPAIPLGWGGFGRRYALNFVDNASSTFFAEAIIPSLLHQDPRYFRKGSGPIKRRMGYSISRLVVARSDGGRWVPNGGQLVGNLAAGSLANLYYPSSEVSLSNTFVRYGINLGTYGLSNLAREFWPDISKLISHKPKP